MNKAILTHSIQEQSIPLVAERFNGLCTNWNWKTAAFAIPIIHQLHRIVGSKERKQIRALVVTPTRACKLDKVLTLMPKYTNLTQLTILVVFHKTRKLTP
jgi:ATP-dependent RNA helicase RhlE